MENGLRTDGPKGFPGRDNMADGTQLGQAVSPISIKQHASRQVAGLVKAEKNDW